MYKVFPVTKGITVNKVAQMSCKISCESYYPLVTLPGEVSLHCVHSSDLNKSGSC